VVVLSITHTKECSMLQTLLEMAKDLVLAQIHAQKLSPEEMQTALQHTYNSLLTLQAQEGSNGIVPVVTPQTLPEPIHWKKSITKHTVTCLACGASFKQLSVRHLHVHGLDGQSYRVQYGIPGSFHETAKVVNSLSGETLCIPVCGSTNCQLEFERSRIPRTQALSAKATTSRRKEIVQQSRPWEKAPTFLNSHSAPFAGIPKQFCQSS
jgi:predicted transcriptional regulator